MSVIGLGDLRRGADILRLRWDMLPRPRLRPRSFVDEEIRPGRGVFDDLPAPQPLPEGATPLSEILDRQREERL